MQKCSIIVPVYNRASLTRQCLNALLNHPPSGCEFEIILVDDGSTDLTQKLLASYGDRIRVVTHDTNNGFATSCNDGAAVALGEYLIFLNNDTLPQDRWLDALLNHATTHPEAAIVGSKLLFPNDTIQHAGVVIGQDRWPRHIYAGFPANHPAVNKSRRFQIVTAACALVRRDSFERIGGFDSSFINGAEDVDLCLRFGESGREVHYCHESVLYHLESVSDRLIDAEEHNGRLYFSRWGYRVQPDDIGYYLEDDLLQVTYPNMSYSMFYPVSFSISPLLGLVEGDERSQRADNLISTRSHQVFELLRANIRLSVRLQERQTQEIPSLEYNSSTEGSTPLLPLSSGNTISTSDSLISTPYFDENYEGKWEMRQPLPPQYLISRVTGSNSIEWFEKTGRQSLRDFEDALALIGVKYEDFNDIYDFGCGCGRIMRWLVCHVPNARVYGSDIDEAAITWMRENIPRVNAQVNGGLPPLPFISASFDLVLGYSVFTHLPEDYQDLWLEELRRVTKPGAVLLLTVHGNYHWEHKMQPEASNFPDFPELTEHLRVEGFLYRRVNSEAQSFPDYYQASWHLPSYIRNHWSRWFDIKYILEGKALGTQDIVVLSRK